jgi:hypothetical protein
MRNIAWFLLMMFACSSAVWAQSSPTIYIVSKSQTDQPAKAGQASSEATAVAHYLEDQIAEAIQEMYPCIIPTEDKDLGDLLSWEKGHQLLDPDYQAHLDQVAESLGARYLIMASVTQTGASEYLKASMIDTATGKTVAMQDKNTGGDNTVDDGHSLAASFAASLQGQFAVKPQGGKNYPLGTVVKAHCTNVQNNYDETSWSEFECWDAAISDWAGRCPAVDSDTCSARFTNPGKFRSVNKVGSTEAGKTSSVEAEFTISGDCKKR